MMALGHASQHVGDIKKTEKKGKEILFNIQGIRSKYAFTSSWLGESDKPEGWILNSLDSSASLQRMLIKTNSNQSRKVFVKVIFSDLIPREYESYH